MYIYIYPVNYPTYFRSGDVFPKFPHSPMRGLIAVTWFFEFHACYSDIQHYPA